MPNLPLVAWTATALTLKRARGMWDPASKDTEQLRFWRVYAWLALADLYLQRATTQETEAALVRDRARALRCQRQARQLAAKAHPRTLHSAQPRARRTDCGMLVNNVAVTRNPREVSCGRCLRQTAGAPLQTGGQADYR